MTNPAQGPAYQPKVENREFDDRVFEDGILVSGSLRQVTYVDGVEYHPKTLAEIDAEAAGADGDTSEDDAQLKADQAEADRLKAETDASAQLKADRDEAVRQRAESAAADAKVKADEQAARDKAEAAAAENTSAVSTSEAAGRHGAPVETSAPVAQ